MKIKHLEGWNYRPNFEEPIDHEELYDLRIDPQENVNRSVIYENHE